MAFDHDGSLTMHNARTGAVGVVPADRAEQARRALLPGTVTVEPLSDILGDLVKGGFLVPAGTDEKLLAHNKFVSRYSSRNLHLIVMPTEQCNFRCVYCYEKFLRGEMSPELQRALVAFVKGQELDQLALSWFGGEPLLAKDVVLSVTGALSEHCREAGISFACGTTTNGWHLVPGLADELIRLGVRRFQVTLDGLRHAHDERRPGLDGTGTFQRIVDNLRYLRSTSHDFIVTVRHNFDPGNLAQAEEFIAFLESEFAGDNRFATHFHPIGRWGGPNDDTLDVCEGQGAVAAWSRLRALSLKAGMGSSLALQTLQPNGNVCYAADPRSFVIGSDGRVYKCTVELDSNDRNIVGQLHPDGTMSVDWPKMALWCETNGMDGDKKCTTCYFSPTCHGAVCPKEWLDDNDCSCPPVKQTIRESLPLIKIEAVLARRSAQTIQSCAD
ncbi:MAG TPA: radical SAM protein [Candidatus Limnocylindrales bacterium]|nr:radical SAM protein [Candidatus Limnocylindrales bacterium]